MIYEGIEIEARDINCIIPTLSRVLLRPIRKYAELGSNLKCPSLRYHLCVDNVDDTSMAKFKFEHVAYIKKLPNPDDRVADFEWRDEQGLPDFDRLEKLVDSRKTRQERQDEIDEYLDLIKECERLNLDSTVFKEALKLKLGG